MKRKRLSRVLLLLGSSILIAGLAPSRSVAATCDPGVAKVVSIQGYVDIRRAGETQWLPAKLNDNFCPDDAIRVQERSRADIALVNQPVLRLDQNTTMAFGGVKKEGGSLIELAKGAIHFFSRLPRNLEVRTAFVNAGVEGTEGFIRAGDDKVEITVFEGKVVAANDTGSLMLTGGQSAVAEKDKAPSYRIVVKPRDAVQWALYYPPVMDVSPEALTNGDVSDPRFLASRAALSLAVGRVDDANADIERALKIDPKSSDALAVQSVIALVQNDKDKALDLAKQAVEADPKSSSAQIAQSYAQQAQFDLEGARKSIVEAVQLNPNDALAWARLAELQLSFGELEKALEAAQRAVSINPNLSRTQTVLGFAYLLRVDTKKAKAAFTKASDLDQADPLPRLGLGLAKFREGQVEAGRREMEIAASLDPNNALIRSYLGKAYFEEKRDKLTEREFATAKELDPKDPTPFYYDAIQKQLTNRPVEALQDMEKAIELNKNRAVYRSKLLIDSDLAARSASLGRIYTDLGFQQVALVEGWLSWNTDPTNFSASRFLSDSYAALPRHEIARVSELLRSQLLQPINITPIQPRLAESNLLLLSAQGPGALSFNEFNTLMVNRDRLTIEGSGLVGENETEAGEAVVAGIYKKLSYSIGYTYFETDGWRTNADQQDYLVDAFVQYELSPNTSVQAEYRYRHSEGGDVQLNFDPNDFRSNQREKAETSTARVGLRHNFSPNSILIASFIYNHRNTSLEFTDPGITVQDSFPDQDAYSGEIQHLFRSKYVNTVAGFGQFNVNATNNVSLTFFPPPTTFPSATDEDQQHSNLYLYSYLMPLDNLTFTLGASGDFYNTDSASTTSKNQFNPKLGMIWEPLPGTTIRAAGFKTLKRTLITDQTLEPTQVAGFNQFYDDVNGTSTWSYGAAIDQKFTRYLFAGFEVFKRDLDVPVQQVTVSGSQVVTGDSTEYQGRGYLFWTPHQWMAFSAEYFYERFKNDNNVAVYFTEVETQRVPLGVGIFHPSGLIFKARGTYYYQNGDFIPKTGVSTIQSGNDEFWVVDASISYRLPKRYGLFTVGATNLLDQSFKYQETDFNNPTIQPGRTAYIQLTLALP